MELACLAPGIQQEIIEFPRTGVCGLFAIRIVITTVQGC